MIGAIIGDIIGSTHEFKTSKNHTGPLFPKGSRITDDTILSIATAYSILNNKDYGDTYADFFGKYAFYENKDYKGLEMGFGPLFLNWAITPEEKRKPYNSYGNGSGMRVSAIAWAFNSIEEVITEAKKSAQCTHNHPEGIKGACAIASAIYLARKNKTREEIKNFIENRFKYNLNFDLYKLNREYTFNVTCQGSVPQAIFCALNANSFEETMRNCLFIGGDTDTIACMAGAIAEPLYSIPSEIKNNALNILNEEPDELSKILITFNKKYWHQSEPVKRLKKVIPKSMNKNKKNETLLMKSVRKILKIK